MQLFCAKREVKEKKVGGGGCLSSGSALVPSLVDALVSTQRKREGNEQGRKRRKMIGTLGTYKESVGNNKSETVNCGHSQTQIEVCVKSFAQMSTVIDALMFGHIIVQFKRLDKDCSSVENTSTVSE